MRHAQQGIPGLGIGRIGLLRFELQAQVRQHTGRPCIAPIRQQRVADQQGARRKQAAMRGGVGFGGSQGGLDGSQRFVLTPLGNIQQRRFAPQLHGFGLALRCAQLLHGPVAPVHGLARVLKAAASSARRRKTSGLTLR
jgi:hypothetical protein